MKLDRRTLLRGMLGGAAVSVALPPLEMMLNQHGEALADGTPLPDRFGLWFWGNGVRPEHWIPATTGPNWTPSTELAPLADLVPQVSVVSGCKVRTSTYPHHGGMTGVLSGQHYHQLGTTRDTIVTTFARQSVDQDAADWFEGRTAFRSLEVGVTRFRGTDEGTTFEHLSHNGPNNPNPSEYDPIAFYRRIFGAVSDPRHDLVRMSVLDAVRGQATRLQSRLGVRDQARLEQHLDSIRALELRLATSRGACAALDEPVPVVEPPGLEPIAEKNALMSSLLTLALACDLTRVFSVQFSTCGSGVVFWQVGATDGMHSTCHVEALPQPIVHAGTTFTMEQLAVFLRGLRDTEEGAGNLLQHSSILCTTELTIGWNHSVDDHPILIAGHGNGRLRGGVHYRSTTLENTSSAVLTALRGAGVRADGWGVDAGFTGTSLSALET
jgi:hypothetical protein